MTYIDVIWPGTATAPWGGAVTGKLRTGKALNFVQFTPLPFGCQAPPRCPCNDCAGRLACRTSIRECTKTTDWYAIALQLAQEYLNEAI